MSLNHPRTPTKRMEMDMTTDEILASVQKLATDMAHVQQAETALEELGGIIEADKRLQAAKECE